MSENISCVCCKRTKEQYPGYYVPFMRDNQGNKVPGHTCWECIYIMFFGTIA